ncbi:uncharacterized protein LOC132756544 [Ruditapes philippinarum]|uniref:uncharacterized protein LOC132756544 n=1 Tax=Ruditapes philippinarum TaxID=129788 RepID=UPI00295B35F8|nr:uncharacterized protein LOC132756544 [Ruditapes philippinarum]XP_060603623.1 uncharacterized protein LOC132756544 [Ruditapes philippinarum]
MENGEGLQHLLSETFAELSGKFKEFNDTVAETHTDEASVKKMLESAFVCWEGITGIMERFKTDLRKRNLIKETLMVPQSLHLKTESWKRDSGIDTVSSSGSPFVSTNRLSACDDDNGSPESAVKFNLKSTNTSYSDFTEDIIEEQPEYYQSEISTVYIHIMPTDQTTDVSDLRERIRDLSRATLKSDNVELHLVPSDSFIGIPASRQSSVSTGCSCSSRPSRQTSTSSEALNFARGRLPSSNDSLTSALLNLSSKIPEEHTDSSDDQSSRFVSSSDSELSVLRGRVQITTGTQTDLENYINGSVIMAQCSAQTQTE